MHKLAVIKNVFSETMQRKNYVSRLCVLLFLIIEDANVNALSLTSCDNPLENEVCNLTCTTTDHSRNVAFNKEPDSSAVAQCVSGGACIGMGPYSISQPDVVTTVLSFIHSRSYSGIWRCSYGPTPASVRVPWATYPQTVSTTLTSNTTVDTNIDGNVTLGCLYSEQAPTVTLQYKDENGNNDVMSAERFQCDATDIPCTDVNFTTYECPVVVKKVTGIGNSDTYSIKLKINVSHVETDDVHTIVTGITFKSSGGTNTSTDNGVIDREAIGILTGCLVFAYIIVIAMVAACHCCGCTWETCVNCCLKFCGNCCLKFCVDCCFKLCCTVVERIVTFSTAECSQNVVGQIETFSTAECSQNEQIVTFSATESSQNEQIVTFSATESSQNEQSFTSSGRESSQEREGDPVFFKDKVLTLKSLCIFGCLVLYGVIVEVIVLLAVNFGYSKFQVVLVAGVGFVIVLVLSGLCLLVVVWMLMKFVNNEKSK